MYTKVDIYIYINREHLVHSKHWNSRRVLRVLWTHLDFIHTFIVYIPLHQCFSARVTNSNSIIIHYNPLSGAVL